jgi:uncharacterized protein YbaP (TraB family)
LKASTLLAVAAAIFALSARAQPPVWTIKGAHSTLILFGSVHMLPPGLDWRPKSLTDGLAKADELWFEIPIGAATDLEAMRLTRTRGWLASGDTLSVHLTPSDDARLARDSAGLGVPTLALEAMAPWLAEVTLSLAVDARAGARVSQGVERDLQDLAPARARRQAFETAGQQIGFLAGAEMAEQVDSLKATLREIEEDPDAYQHLLDAWMTGDLAAIQAQALNPLRSASPTLYERLITDRNRRWAKLVRRRMAGRGRVVMIVGIGHLIGPEGLPALLRAQGIRVDGP